MRPNLPPQINDAVGSLRAALKGFSANNGSQHAAAISYYALLSVFPAAIAATAIGGAIIGHDTARDSLVDAIEGAFPLSAKDGRAQVEELVAGVTSGAGTIGLVGLLGLLFSGSGLIGALRTALGEVFDAPPSRGAVVARLTDIGILFLLGGLVAASFAISLASGLGLNIGAEIGLDGAIIRFVANAVAALISLLLIGSAYLVLIRLLPGSTPSLRAAWPGLALAVALTELVRRSFGLYIENFANYNAVYGSLGAVIAALSFVYVTSCAFLIGAELVAFRWTAVQPADRS